MEVREPSAKYLAKPAYKQTGVGVIPADWEVKPLGEIGEALIGLTYKPAEVRDHGTLVLRSSNIQNDALSFEDSVFVNAEIPARIMVRSDDVLICVRNGSRDLIGKSALLDERTKGMTFGAFMAVYRSPIGKLASYLFQSAILKRQINEHLGATINQITNRSLNSFQIPVPPTETEQRAIATALSDVDALLGGLERLIAKKRDLKQAAMQQLLTGQTRLPGFSGEWEVKRLGELAKIQRGASPRPIDSPAWFEENSTVGWVRISDVTSSGMFLCETTQRLSPLGVKHSRPVATGSLIMSICATVGRPIITRIDVCIHDGFVVFDNLEADQLFAYYVLKWIEPDWTRHGQTGSQMNLNTGLINGTVIKLPPRAEQTAIAAVLSDMDAELSALAARRDKSRDLKQAMMQELLTGRIRLV
ncbi:MAG: restriction endonuclease subunit S [Sulfuritalea sp.]|nr:restriction endonuclease subunit S [Sulfuritalea sp.]